MNIDRRHEWIAASGAGWQLGEQGMLQGITDVLEISHGLVVEVGAGNGTDELPLTARRLIDAGWDSILVEANPVSAEALRQRTAHWKSRPLVVQQMALPADMDTLVPQNTTILIIDVDSIDYYLWEALSSFPPVVMIEHHDLNDPRVPRDKGHLPPIEACGKDQTGCGFTTQATHLAIDELAEKKGYRLLARTAYNSLYAISAVADRLLHRCEGVHAVISQPRIGFSDFEDCVRKSIAALQMPLARYASVACWEKGLTWACESSIGAGAEFILTLDYDSVFSPADVVRLVNTMRDHPELNALWPVQARRHDGTPLTFEKGLAYDGQITIKDFGHFGCTLIRAKALSELPHPWFWSMPDPRTGKWDSPLTSDTDITFWRSVKLQGWRVAQANRVMIGHLEMAVMWLSPEGVAWQAAPAYMRKGRPAKVGFNPDLYQPKGPPDALSREVFMHGVDMKAQTACRIDGDTHAPESVLPSDVQGPGVTSDVPDV